MNEVQQARIAALNDQFCRGNRSLGLYSLSPQVEALATDRQQALLEALGKTNCFIDSQAVHADQDHDFGLVSLDETDYFWEIDYYNQDLKAVSPDPADPDSTVRVLSVLRTDEYDR